MPYYDYGGFGEPYFEGASVSNPNPAGYSKYTRDLLPWSWYAQVIRDELVSQGIDPSGEKVLIVGCAYGYTIEYLVDNWNVDAYGMDVSSWAVNQADTATSYGGRIYQGDITANNAVKDIQKATPGGKFAVIMTESVLSCLTDAEAQTATDQCRNEAQQTAVHRVWSTDGSDINTDYYNGKSLAEWQSLCDPNSSDDWMTDYQFHE